MSLPERGSITQWSHAVILFLPLLPIRISSMHAHMEPGLKLRSTTWGLASCVQNCCAIGSASSCYCCFSLSSFSEGACTHQREKKKKYPPMVHGQAATLSLICFLFHLYGPSWLNASVSTETHSWCPHSTSSLMSYSSS